MSTNDRNEIENHKAVIGKSDNFWLYSSRSGFDLSHPATPSTPISTSITIQTTTAPIAIDPAKSALIVIDMQNYFLSPALGRARGAGHAAADQLVRYAVPAARKAGIRVVWVNWGLTEKEADEMPPAITRAFGFEGTVDCDGKEKFDGVGFGLDKHGRKSGKVYHGLCSEMGVVKDEDGEEIEAGRVLMRDAWNSALYPPLNQIYEEGRKLESRPDVWIHKNRMSGMWGVGGDLELFLEKEGTRTLFFTGVNTDQCVGGTLTDSFSKGYDCILLNDGAGTTSPEYAQQCYEFNSANTYGFAASCEQFAAGIDSRGSTKSE